MRRVIREGWSALLHSASYCTAPNIQDYGVSQWKIDTWCVGSMDDPSNNLVLDVAGPQCAVDQIYQIRPYKRLDHVSRSLGWISYAFQTIDLQASCKWIRKYWHRRWIRTEYQIAELATVSWYSVAKSIVIFGEELGEVVVKNH